MSTEKEQYERWLEHVSAQEAEQLREQADSIEELHDAFYRELAFGTAGLRGIIGLGPNRMNVYTVGKATQALPTISTRITRIRASPLLAIVVTWARSSSPPRLVCSRQMASSRTCIALSSPHPFSPLPYVTCTAARAST